MLSDLCYLGFMMPSNTSTVVLFGVHSDVECGIHTFSNPGRSGVRFNHCSKVIFIDYSTFSLLPTSKTLGKSERGFVLPSVTLEVTLK